MYQKGTLRRRVYAAAALLMVLLFTGCSSVSETPTPAVTQAPAQTAQATASPITILGGGITMDSTNIDEADAYTDWTSGAYTEIALSATGYTNSGQGAVADGAVLTISAAGTYVLTGKQPNGAIVVDAGDSDEVRIVLNGAAIACNDGAPLYIKNANQVTLSLAPGTENSLTDGAAYTYALYDTAEGEPSAALFAKDDLVINGTGTLNITAASNDGISVNDDIKIIEGTLNITAADDGIVGKDMVAVKTGNLTIDAGGDGIKSTNDTNAEKGFVAIADGTFAITSGADGIQAQTELYIAGGDFTIVSGGGRRSAGPNIHIRRGRELQGIEGGKLSYHKRRGVYAGQRRRHAAYKRQHGYSGRHIHNC